MCQNPSFISTAGLESSDEIFVLLMGKLTRIVFKDGLGRFARGSVKEHDRCDIVPVWLGDAGYLLGQDPHTYPVVPCTEPQINQLARAAFHIFRRGAVIKYE